ncbi:MAG: protein-disulfide reductase DsbD domain-containing protein [Pyrinomonadaceae bacterium]
MHHTKLLLIACLLLTCAACSGSAPTVATNANVSTTTTATPTVASTPEEIVRASADEIALKAGASGEAHVHLQIADGYHVNANPATFSYLKATELELTPTEGFTAGRPAYPQAVNKKFQFAPQPLAVYEHEAMIKLPLHASASAPKGAQTLHAQVQVQACDEEKCFPPTIIPADIAVTIN